MFSPAFVRLFVSRIYKIRRGEVAHGPRKKRRDFGGNPDHITLR